MAGCAGDEPADTGRWFNPNPPDELGTDERPADVVLPEDYTVERTWPLVIMLHGYGANSVVQDSIFGLGNRVDSMGFLLLKPDGTVDTSGRQFWNAFTECCDFGNTGVDDVGYLASLIEQARETYPISHVAFVGHSNGGYMSYRMACDRPDLIDRIAPLAGTLSAIPSECTGTEAVRVLHMHGTEDNSVAYESTSVHNGARAFEGAESIREAVKVVRQHDHHPIEAPCQLARESSLLDGAGLLLFVIPGLFAFAVDFVTGAIYLPEGGRSRTLDAFGEVRSIPFDPLRTDQHGVAELVARETGVEVDLTRGRSWKLAETEPGAVMAHVRDANLALARSRPQLR